jgi:sterol desaturase/sphingolipid hydroxylase (fatty acid hydroxylase superfamily)
MFQAEQLAVWAGAVQTGLPLALLGGLAAWEAVRSERHPVRSRRWRWVTNLGLEATTQLLLRWVPLYAVTVAGLQLVGNPRADFFAPVQAGAGSWAVLAAAGLLLDLTGYLIHRLQHALFPLWCLHAVHHADVDVDASTAVRHHPLEALVSGLLLLPLILVLGVPLWTLPIYGLLVQVAQLLQHANCRWPERAETLLSLVLVTPGLHRAHHAAEARYGDSHFGTVLSVWDRLFGTFGRCLPQGLAAPVFGLRDSRQDRDARPVGALLLPWRLLRGHAR